MRAHKPIDIHAESFLQSLLRQQFRLSARFGALFLAALLGLPLANYLWPELMATRVFGFTLTWLILGVGFFPMVWVISWLFIRRSMELEARVVSEVEASSRPAPAEAAPLRRPTEGAAGRGLPQTT